MVRCTRLTFDLRLSTICAVKFFCAPEFRGTSNSSPGSDRLNPDRLRRLAALIALATAAASCVLAETAATRLREAGNQPAPLFALQDLQKQLHSLDGFAGRVVVVHFFATWCEPCRDELASLNLLATHLPDAAVLAVDAAEPVSRVAKFFSGNPVGFRVVLDTDRAVTKAWAVATVPTTIVLGPDLQPRLIAEGQMDWGNPDVVAQLRTLTNATQQQASREKKE